VARPPLRELQEQGVNTSNPNFWQALLTRQRQAAWRGTVPCFFGEDLPEAQALLIASEGPYGIYAFSPNAGDHFVWLNDPHMWMPITISPPMGRGASLTVRSRSMPSSSLIGKG
jgi:hypothetical protein